MKKILALIFACGLFGNAMAQEMIVDTDMGVDDAVALMYLLNHPEVQVKAITIAADGSAHCLPALRNTAGLLSVLKQSSIPVACGRLQPLEGTHQFLPATLKQSDTLAGASKFLPRIEVANSQTAAHLLISTTEESDQPIDIVALGPLTNIADALQVEPGIKNKIRMIYIMGGAVHVPGNVNTNNAAEWNIYVDPVAADIVFRSGIPITLIPLDATMQAQKTGDMQIPVRNQGQRLSAEKFTNELLRKVTGNFYDPLAAAIAVNESLADYKTERLSVVLDSEAHAGATVVDDSQGTKIRVAQAIDPKEFHSELMQTLNRI